MSDSDYQGKLVSTNNVVFNTLQQVQARDGNKTKADGAPTIIAAASVVKVWNIGNNAKLTSIELDGWMYSRI